MSNIQITKTTAKKEKPAGELGFGKYFTDHMLIVDYMRGAGWHNARIVPYGDIAFDPAAMVFHYGQESFEGLKAYRTENGKILLFRPDCNANRMNQTSDRLCMPEIDVVDWVNWVKALVEVDSDWVPEKAGTSLYIRPFIIAVDPFIGVRASDSYKFIVILSPVGNYYPEGLNPVKIYIETEYVRAVKGGTGFTKCGGNYGASIKAQTKAHDEGFSQVLWLDGIERKYIEEVGTMNVFFKIGGKIITPALEGSILPGITRRSCIEILKDWGYTVEERLVSLAEVEKAAADGTLEEMFGTGTAAVISPVGQLRIGKELITINDNKIGDLSQKLYDELTGIQWGKIADKRGWTVVL